MCNRLKSLVINDDGVAEIGTAEANWVAQWPWRKQQAQTNGLSRISTNTRKSINSQTVLAVTIL